jgi:membrane protease YdiL (CAAX protease family)
MAKLALLAVILAIAALTWIDYRQYAQFKLLESSELRRRRFLYWIGQSFGLFTAIPVVWLAATGRIADLLRLPPEFGQLGRGLRERALFSEAAAPLIGGLVVGAVIGGVASAIVQARRSSPLVIGDVTPLLPRNRAELACTTLLSINAGVSEEIGFRLFLPLVAYAAFGNAVAAFVVAGVVFAAVHVYQGWVGVVASGVLGAVLTLVYLASGQLWLVMLAHALIDLNGLALRPVLSGVLKPRPAG